MAKSAKSKKESPKSAPAAKPGGPAVAADLATLKAIVDLMVEAGLSEVNLEEGNKKIHLARGAKVVAGAAPVGFAAPAAAPAPAAAAQAKAGEPPAPPAAKADTINSQMVGTFYAASSPDAKPFVKAGDTVTADTVVCIIEAMKVFNEIKAGKAGTIAKVLVESGKPVEFGTPLFELK